MQKRQLGQFGANPQRRTNATGLMLRNNEWCPGKLKANLKVMIFGGIVMGRGAGSGGRAAA